MEPSTLFVSAVLACCGVIHLVPAVGVAGVGALERLYGVAPSSTADLLLLRHRAVLFGVVGAAMVWGALHPGTHGPTLTLATVCVLGFLLLWPSQGSMPPQLLRVRRVDLGLAVLLGVAWVVWLTTAL